jgi:hypothetical protein
MNHVRRLYEPYDIPNTVATVKTIYENYRSTITDSMRFIHVNDYERFTIADITHLNDIFESFNGHIINFTGWYANQIAQMCSKPSIVICRTTEDSHIFKGSARSLAEFDVYTPLDTLPFVNGGGHKGAYGFAVHEDDLEELIAHFYYGLPEGQVIDTKENVIEINYLHELEKLEQDGVITTLAHLNDYKVGQKVGIQYTVRRSDVLDYKPKYCDIKYKKYRIRSFNKDLKPGDIVLLEPEFSRKSIEMTARRLGTTRKENLNV